MVERASGRIVTCRRKSVAPSPSLVACSLCRLLYHVPVTLKCGHTFCKSCVEESVSCKVCSMPIGCKKLSANVSLAAIVSQLYPEGTQHRSLIDEADKLVNIGSNTRAIAKYDECLKIDENSAVSYRKRSRVFSKTGNYAGSILDSDRAIALDRLCPEVTD